MRRLVAVSGGRVSRGTFRAGSGGLPIVPAGGPLGIAVNDPAVTRGGAAGGFTVPFR